MNSIKLVKNLSNILNCCHFSHKQLIHYKTKVLTTLSSIHQKRNISEKSTQNLVIDLSFDDIMSAEECHRLAQLLFTIVYTNNGLESDEIKFKINVCNNLTKNSKTIEYLNKYLPQNQKLNNFEIHDKSYLNLFDNQRLVYLSPDATQTIDFDANDIYIIGGIVQKHIFKKASNRLTYLKAVEEGVRVGRLPIDHLISDDMKAGIVLFLPQVFLLLTDVKSRLGWESAVRRHLPKWKLKTTQL